MKKPAVFIWAFASGAQNGHVRRGPVQRDATGAFVLLDILPNTGPMQLHRLKQELPPPRKD